MSRFTSIMQSDAPTCGAISDELTSNTLTAAALGGLGGVGLGACMTLAPRTTIGLACIGAALLGAMSHQSYRDRLRQGNLFPST